MEYVHEAILKNKKFLETCCDGLEGIMQECDSYFKEVDLFLETGNADFFQPTDVEKENVESVGVRNKRKGRSRKPALADVTENNVLVPDAATAIKKEKISIIQEIDEDLSSNVQIKKETEEMPAPTRLPPRKKKIKTETLDLPKRSTRTRTKKIVSNDEKTSDTENTRTSKSSDVIIQNTTITTIDISDERETDSETDKTSSQKEMRSTRSKMKMNNKPVKESSNKESGDEETGKHMRNTRTKTRQKKRSRSKSTEHTFDQTEKKKSRSDSNLEKECTDVSQTRYEDAVSVLENNQDVPQSAANATYIATSTKRSLSNEDSSSCINSTVVVENPKLVVHSNEDIPSSINSTIVVEKPKMVTKETDQSKPPKSAQRKEETPKTPPKCAKKNGNKQIFSPFEKTPVKKKVEAFERLGVESSGIPTRTTRTKKKTQKNDNEHKEENEGNPSDRKGKHSSEKEKPHTPLPSKFVPNVCSTSKISKLHPTYNNTSTSNESILSVKSASALKASQAEFREREKRRQEKEREALRKREALLLAQTEEKRRKREEKQLRAQQQREILEKEMQKQLEAQRVKEEKYKQAMAERERKLQKQKEEAEKKRQMAKKKANELLKEKEEEIRMAEQQKYAEMKAVQEKQAEMAKMLSKQKGQRGQQNSIPMYMVTKPPLLPTYDCYDSDDPEYDAHKRTDPAWSTGKEMKEMQLTMITVGETIKNSFFCIQAQTPDLQEIFETIDPRKLKRTSSAIWRKPPRYTLMPTLDDTIEFSEESD